MNTRVSNAIASETWLHCPECEAPCLDRPLPPKSELRCTRCGVRVKRSNEGQSLQAAWAFAMTGLVFVILANVQPVMTFSVAGNSQSTKIITGVFSLMSQGYDPVAFLVFFSGIAAPALHLLAVSYVCTACCLRLRLPWLGRVTRWSELLAPWNLVPVYAVAALVAVVKLDLLGHVEWREGALWVIALSLSSLLTNQFFDGQLVEDRLEELHHD